MERMVLLSLALVVALIGFAFECGAMSTTTEMPSNSDLGQSGSGNSSSMQHFIGGRKKRSSKSKGIVVMPIGDDDDDDDRRKKRDVGVPLVDHTLTGVGGATKALGL